MNVEERKRQREEEEAERKRQREEEEAAIRRQSAQNFISGISPKPKVVQQPPKLPDNLMAQFKLEQERQMSEILRQKQALEDTRAKQEREAKQAKEAKQAAREAKQKETQAAEDNLSQATHGMEIEPNMASIPSATSRGPCCKVCDLVSALFLSPRPFLSTAVMTFFHLLSPWTRVP